MKTELCFFRISNGGLAAKDFPSRLKLLNWGDNQSLKGVVRVGDLTLSALAANQKELGFDRIALDYEHNTLKGTEAFKADKEPRKVAAYGVPRVVAGDGLYLDEIEWTPSGREFAREYIDLSPTPRLTASREVDFLHSVALCRQGAVDDLSFYSVDLSESKNPNKERTVKRSSELLALLALSAEATDDQVEAAFAARIVADAAALTALSAQVKDLAGKLTALTAAGTENGKTEDGKSPAVIALTAKVAVLEGNVTSFSAELAKRDRAALVDQAGREGKVIPLTAEQIAIMPIPVLGDMIAKLPVTVPLTALTVDGIREKAIGNAIGNAITENDRKIAAACGVKLPESK
jgi:phage I-like protein